MAIPSFRSRSRAFTLTELLLAMLLLAVLAALVFAVMKRAGEVSQEATCAHRLRQIGILYHAYVGENNMKSRLFVGGKEGMNTYGWYPILRRKGNLGDVEAQKAFGCPSLDWRETQEWFCYGFRAGGAPGFIEALSDEDGRLYVINVATVAEPSAVLLASDTATSAKLKFQAFRFARANAPEARIHLRHSGRANGLFLDGHVRALGASDLYEAAIEEVYDAGGGVVKTKP